MKYYVVDVFSDTPFSGNPVAVVFTDRQMDTSKMLAIASWFNLSETTFVTEFQPDAGKYKVRIFTPRGELPFAGHPSLGTAAAVSKHFNYRSEKIKQDCQAGLIDIRYSASNSNIHLIALQPKFRDAPLDLKSRLSDVLSLDESLFLQAEIVDSGPYWTTALLSDSQALEALCPDFSRIETLSNELGATGIMLGAPDSHSKHYKVRTFAPAFGVPEDPVCGSGNIALAFLRAEKSGDSSDYQARQGQEIGRDGRVEIAYLEDGSIELGGATVITASGELDTGLNE